MTVVELEDRRAAAGTPPAAAAGLDPAAAARAEADAAAAAGDPINGADLGRRHGLSERRGREIAAAARAAAGGGGTPERRAAPPRRSAAGGGAAAAADRRPPAAARTAARAAAPPAAAGRRSANLITVVRWLVGGVAAAVSYGHMYGMAMAAGEHLWLARAWPLTVDGLVVVAMRRGGSGGRWWLYVALGVSLASNVAAQFPEAVAATPAIRIAVAAWPALAFAAVHQLTHDQGSGR